MAKQPIILPPIPTPHTGTYWVVWYHSPVTEINYESDRLTSPEAVVEYVRVMNENRPRIKTWWVVQHREVVEILSWNGTAIPNGLGE